MRNELVTDFWRKAYDSVPAHVRAQYHGHFVAAERWELSFGALIELWSRAKAAVRNIFHAPRARHGH
jgi:hypothetical protein